MKTSLQKKKDRKVVEHFPWITKYAFVDIIIIFLIVAAIVTIIWGIATGRIDLSLVMLQR